MRGLGTDLSRFTLQSGLRGVTPRRKRRRGREGVRTGGGSFLQTHGLGGEDLILLEKSERSREAEITGPKVTELK